MPVLGWPKETTLERVDFSLRLPMFVSAVKVNLNVFLSSVSLFLSAVGPATFCQGRAEPVLTR